MAILNAASETKEIRSLTGLRGIAASFVVIYHFFQIGAPRGPIRNFVLHGYIAVDLFFVLSGFVIALTYAKNFAPGFSFRAYGDFLYKRFGRIYPLYFVGTAAGLAIAFLFHTEVTRLKVLSNLFLVQTWGIAPSIDDTSWSISTEFAAYLAFPLLTLLLLHSRPRIAGAVAAIALGILILVATRSAATLNEVGNGIPFKTGPLDVFGPGTPYPLLRCLAGFTLGVLAFRLAGLPAVQRIARSRPIGDVIALIVLVLLVVPGSDIVLVLAFVPLIICLACEAGIVARLMASPVIYWLGLVSYSIYITHRLIELTLRDATFHALSALHAPHAFTATHILLIGPVVAVSALTFYAIERPARRWSRRLIRLPARPIASEPAAP